MKRQHSENINTGAHFDALYAGPRREEMMPAEALKVLIPAIVNGGVPKIDGQVKVLDVGCGWGQYYPYLSANEAFVHGIDFAADAIAEAREQFPDGYWSRADFSQTLPYVHSFFDYVVCLETLEHMENPAALVWEMYRVLDHQGILILTVPYRDTVPVEEHLWEFEEADLREFCKDFYEMTILRYSDLRVGDAAWDHFLVIARKA